MAVNLFERAIDTGAELCGGQNALGRKIGCTSANLSEAKHGRLRLNEAQIAGLAQVLGTDAAELWELQELANMPRRNPFKHALSKSLAAFFLVNLSACSIGDLPSGSSTYALPSAGDLIAHCRALVRIARRLSFILRMQSERPVPMAWAC